MKKKAEKDRYVLMVKYWIDGKESEALEGSMAANSLRSARAEFRERLRDVLYPATLSRNDMKEIVEAGYVVASGPITPFANRFAMTLIDKQKAPHDPPMYAFTFRGEWSFSRFDPHPNGAK